MLIHTHCGANGLSLTLWLTGRAGNNAAGRVRDGNCWWLALSGLLASIFICVRAGLMDMATARFHARLRDTVMAAVATRPTPWVEDNCHKGAQLAQSGDALKQNIYRSHLEVLWSAGQVCGQCPPITTNLNHRDCSEAGGRSSCRQRTCTKPREPHNNYFTRVHFAHRIKTIVEW
jgi:hypothetical protein